MYRALEMKDVPISCIKLYDRSFKVSRNHVTDEFKNAVREHGILDPPLLLEEESGYTVIFGFNRIEAARETGAETISARIISKLIPEHYINELLLKSLRNEIGPAGKIRAIALCRRSLVIDNPAMLLQIQKSLGVPHELISKHELSSAIDSFPSPLRDYIDLKDIGFKTIVKVASLSCGIIDMLSSWVAISSISVSLFKQIVLMISDIAKRDGSLEPVDCAKLQHIEDRRERGEYIFQQVYKVRYPEYTVLMQRVASARSALSKKGFELKYPHYFDGDSFSIAITIQRSETFDSIKRKFGALPEDVVRELQGLL